MVVTVTGFSRQGKDIIEYFPEWRQFVFPFRAVVVYEGNCIHVPKHGSVGLCYFTTK